MNESKVQTPPRLVRLSNGDFVKPACVKTIRKHGARLDTTPLHGPRYSVEMEGGVLIVITCDTAEVDKQVEELAAAINGQPAPKDPNDLGGGYQALIRDGFVIVRGPDKHCLSSENGAIHQYKSLEEAAADVKILRRLTEAPPGEVRHQDIPGLLETRNQTMLQWREPWPACGPQGNDVSAHVTLQATVHDCINLSRLSARRAGLPTEGNDENHLLDFIALNWARIIPATP